MTILGQDDEETDVKNWTSRNSASEQRTPYKMVKKQFRLLNRSILMSELGVSPNYKFRPTRRGGHRREKLECKEFNF